MSAPSLLPPVLPLMGTADLASRLDLRPSLSLQTCWICGPSKQWTVTISRVESYPDFLLSILHKEVPAGASGVTEFAKGNKVHEKAVEGLGRT